MKASALCFEFLFFGRRGLPRRQPVGRDRCFHSKMRRSIPPVARTHLTRKCWFSIAPNEGDHTLTDRRIITYLTDLEGDANYLDRFVRRSKVLEFRNTLPRYTIDDFFPYDHSIDFLASNAVLVYGGDIWDRGGFDLFVVRQLLDLRRRYPSRVHFLMGNRDINKMRVLNELGVTDRETDSSARMPYHNGVYWLKGTGRVGDPTRSPNAGVSQTNAAERLRWMLRQTMGSPKAFELRRNELFVEREQRGETMSTVSVSDEDVVDSYRASCHPSSGEMGKYLSQAQLVLKLGKILFLHGALPLTPEVLQQADRTSNGWKKEHLRLYMPWRNTEDSDDDVPDSIDAWINALNSFARTCVTAWKEDVRWHEQEHGNIDSTKGQSQVWSTRGGYRHYPSSTLTYGDLMQYGMGWMPTGDRNPTVVYSSWMSNGMPRRFFPNAEVGRSTFSKLTREFFEEADLDLIACGHQPQGDTPTSIRVDDSMRRWILCCDTNYAGDTVWLNSESDVAVQERTDIKRGVGGRGGNAVSEVLIEQCTKSGSTLDVRCHGVLSNGREFDVKMTTFASDSLVGKLAGPSIVPPQFRTHDWWVKSHLDNDSYLISSGEGYQVWNCIVHHS